MLWPNTQMQLSSPLKNIHVTFHFGPAGGTAVFIRPSSDPNGRIGGDGESPEFETPLHYNDIGELINETQIVNNGKRSAGLSVEGHYPEKDGITPCRLPAKAVTAHDASLTALSTPRRGVSSPLFY